MNEKVKEIEELSTGIVEVYTKLLNSLLQEIVKLNNRIKELGREKNILKGERDGLRRLHDAGIREAYRICGIVDDGEYRWKWVLLELSALVNKVKKLKEG